MGITQGFLYYIYSVCYSTREKGERRDGEGERWESLCAFYAECFVVTTWQKLQNWGSTVWWVFLPSFLLFWSFRPTRNIWNIFRRHYYRWKATNFNWCAAFMALEPLSSEGSLACHINNDTGHPFIMVRDTHTYWPIAERLEAVTTCFNDLGL